MMMTMMIMMMTTNGSEIHVGEDAKNDDGDDLMDDDEDVDGNSKTSPSLAALNRSSISPSLFIDSCHYHHLV